MKLSTEDNPQEPNDYLALLSYLWKHNISVNNKAISNQLTILNSDGSITGWIEEHYFELEHWLPGVCDGCLSWVIERTESPYGSHPHCCFRCLSLIIGHFETHHWPEPNWYPGEEVVIDQPDEEDERSAHH